MNYKVEADAWAGLPPESTLSMDDFVTMLKGCGAEIIERDDAGRRVLILNRSAHVEVDVWVCEKCGSYGRDRAVVEVHERDCHGINASRGG